MNQEIERANSYRMMMESWAWQDFKKYMESQRQAALETAHLKKDILETKVESGKIQAFDDLFSHISYVLGFK